MVKNMKEMVLIVGYTGSGKTSITEQVAEKLGKSFASFNQIARSYVQSLGYKGVRDYWTKTDSSDFVQNLNKYILQYFYSSKCSIFEGLPSISVLNALKSSSQYQLRVVYLDVPFKIRKNRVLKRCKYDEQKAYCEIELKHEFKQALGIEKVISEADKTIDASRPFEDVILDVQVYLHTFFTGG
jgi:dephospho-CoA kinase